MSISRQRTRVAALAILAGQVAACSSSAEGTEASSTPTAPGTGSTVTQDPTPGGGTAPGQADLPNTEQAPQRDGVSGEGDDESASEIEDDDTPSTVEPARESTDGTSVAPAEPTETSVGEAPPATDPSDDSLAGSTDEPPSDGAATSPGAEQGDTSAAPATLGDCTREPWPEADPSVAGPFEIITETEVGPLAGEGEDGEPVPFTLFRPADLNQAGVCHPVVTWGNGSGSNPSLYGVLLRHLASHGFIVIGSDSPNVAQGDPPPMVAGVSWLIEQNDDPSSEFYRRVDTSHVGATGHSQGGFASTAAGADGRIATVAPLCGAAPQRSLHGPALLLCGGQDTVATCENIGRSFDSIEGHPVMLANFISADHANWITFRGTSVSPMEVAVTAWMRVHLMGDTALRPWFYGPDCSLCSDPAWQVQQKLMDE